MTLASAHQMGSCRMAKNEKEGPVTPTGELYECENLFVADGSLLPTALGINPMMTIAAMGDMVSKRVLEKLERDYPELKKKMQGFKEVEKW